MPRPGQELVLGDDDIGALKPSNQKSTYSSDVQTATNAEQTLGIASAKQTAADLKTVHQKHVSKTFQEKEKMQAKQKRKVVETAQTETQFPGLSYSAQMSGQVRGRDSDIENSADSASDDSMITPGAVAIPGSSFDRSELVEDSLSIASSPEDEFPVLVAELADSEQDVEARVTDRLQLELTQQLQREVAEQLELERRRQVFVEAVKVSERPEPSQEQGRWERVVCGVTASKKVCLIVFGALLLLLVLVIIVVVVVVAGAAPSSSSPASPISNGCENATVIPTLGSTTLGTNEGVDIEEEATSCGTAEVVGPGVWYVVAGTGSLMRASTCESTGALNDTQISVFGGGSCGSLECIGGNDNSCGSKSSIMWKSVPEERYHVYVHSSDNERGTFELVVDEVPELDVLFSLPFDASPALFAQDTPQAQALDWLSKNTNLDSLSSERVIQRYALATFYYITGGSSWDRNDLWLSQQNECVWHSTDASLKICDDQDRLLVLVLESNELEGTLPPEVGLLDSLEIINLNGNSLKGVLPTTLGLLSNLRELRVEGNIFTGTIPTEVGLMTSLEQVWTASDFVCGHGGTQCEPSSKLTGTIPTEMAALSRLTHLFLEDNELTGTIPIAVLLGMTSLLALDLDYNNFRGTLSTQLGLLTDLEYLDLNNNAFFGTVPSEIGAISGLEVLTLEFTNLQGTVPSEVCALRDQRLGILAAFCEYLACTCGCICFSIG